MLIFIIRAQYFFHFPPIKCVFIYFKIRSKKYVFELIESLLNPIILATFVLQLLPFRVSRRVCSGQ